MIIGGAGVHCVVNSSLNIVGASVHCVVNPSLIIGGASVHCIVYPSLIIGGASVYSRKAFISSRAWCSWNNGRNTAKKYWQVV